MSSIVITPDEVTQVSGEQSHTDIGPTKNGRWFDRRYTAYAIFLLLSVTLSGPVLGQHGVPMHGDLTYPWHLRRYLDNYLYLFSDSGSVSNLESLGRAFALLPLTALIYAVGGSMVALHTTIMVSLPVISMCSAYELNRFVAHEVDPRFDKPLCTVIPAILYGFSPWALEQIQAYLFWLAYALTPLLLMLLFRFLRHPGFWNALAIAVVMSYIASSPQYLCFSIALITMIALAAIVARPVRRSLALSHDHTKWALITTIIFATLNFYWLYPTFVVLKGGALSPGYSLTQAMTEQFGYESSLPNVLRGYDQWVYWYKADPRVAVVLKMPYRLGTLLIPFTALAGLLPRKTHRSFFVMSIVVCAACFGLLALGNRTPIYDWLVFHLPVTKSFNWVFRVPGKLSYLLWTSYSVLLCLGIGWLKINSKVPLKAMIAIVSTGTLGVAVLILPKALPYFRYYYAPVSVPTAYQQLDRFMASQPGLERIFYLAPYSNGFGQNTLGYETSSTWNPGRLAAATPVISSVKPSIGYYHLTYRDWQTTLYQPLYRSIPPDVGHKYMAPANVGFLVYTDDVVGASRAGQEDLAALRASDLREVAAFDFIHIFASPDPLPLLRPKGGNIGSEVRTRRINPAHYKGTVIGPVKEIEMGQFFDGLWHLSAGGRVINGEPSGLTSMIFRLPNGTTHFDLEYGPQSSYQIGLWVSGLSAVAILILAGVRCLTRTRGFAFKRRSWPR